MPIEGYIRKKPDIGWWLDQWRAGKQFRKKFASEGEWEKWRSFYRGDWKAGILPVNLYFTMVRTIVPRIYFRNPSISVSPGKPGFDNMAFARILERIDNKLMRQMKLKREIKRMVQDTFMFGTGFGKIGFGAQFTPSPLLGITNRPLGKAGQALEFRDDIFPNMPWFSRVRPKDIVVPTGLGVYEDSRWVCHEVVRPLSDVKADPRFKNTRGLKTSKIIMNSFAGVQRPIKLTTLLEFRDKQTQTVFVISPDGNMDDPLLFETDELQDNGFTIKPTIFNLDDEVFWGLPDTKILEPYQLEINEIRTQNMKHRRLTLIKIFARTGAFTEDEAAKLVDEEIMPVIFLKGKGAIRDQIEIKQIAGIPDDLRTAADDIRQDVRETVGFSRNQFGEFKPGSGDTTATEANIVRQATEIRVDERRDMIADFIVDIMETVHQVIFRHWGTDEVVDLVGPGGVSVWVKFSGELLRTGKYSIKVDPDSSVPETRALREQKALQLYQILKTNPIIDPAGLTLYLLHELHGVQFDNLMRSLPPVQGQTNEAISPGEFGNRIQQGVQGLQNAPALESPENFNRAINGDGRENANA